MNNIQKVRIKDMLDKTQCFFGIHHFERVEDYSEVRTSHIFISKYRQKCHVCDCDQDVKSVYTQWGDCDEEIMDCRYAGNFNWLKVLKSSLSRINTNIRSWL